MRKVSSSTECEWKCVSVTPAWAAGVLDVLGGSSNMSYVVPVHTQSSFALPQSQSTLISDTHSPVSNCTFSVYQQHATVSLTQRSRQQSDRWLWGRSSPNPVCYLIPTTYSHCCYGNPVLRLQYPQMCICCLYVFPTNRMLNLTANTHQQGNLSQGQKKEHIRPEKPADVTGCVSCQNKPTLLEVISSLWTLASFLLSCLRVFPIFMNGGATEINTIKASTQQS